MNRLPRSCVIIINDYREILLIKRQKQGRIYQVFPGGSIEPGESAEQAAVRESLEELSLTVIPERCLFQQENNGRKETYFLVRDYSGSVALGSGPERQRQCESNTYEPVWIPLKQLLEFNIQPESAGKKVLKMYNENQLWLENTVNHS